MKSLVKKDVSSAKHYKNSVKIIKRSDLFYHVTCYENPTLLSITESDFFFFFTIFKCPYGWPQLEDPRISCAQDVVRRMEWEKSGPYKGSKTKIRML